MAYFARFPTKIIREYDGIHCVLDMPEGPMTLCGISAPRNSENGDVNKLLQGGHNPEVCEGCIKAFDAMALTLRKSAQAGLKFGETRHAESAEKSATNAATKPARVRGTNKGT